METKPRILFVDDEPNILSGLRRMLRPMRTLWEMEFAEDGLAALDLMEKSPCEIVVSDMRMPGMDGAELLSKVKAIYPDTIRIILSGHSEMDSVLKSIGPSHQYLSKPCDPELLKNTILRATSLRDLMKNEKLKALVSQTTSLPSLPKLFQAVVDELQKPNASLNQIGELISRDVGMSAKILKIVNSAYFGLLAKINSVERAVTYLGLETINSLVLAAEIFSTYEEIDLPGFSIDALWDHSLKTATFARTIARKVGMEKNEIDDSFMAALLHDVGKLILAGNIPEEYARILRKQKDEKLTFSQAEMEELGATHAEIGAYLIGLWGLPDNIVEAVAFHQIPSSSPSSDVQPLTAVHAADVLARTLHHGGASSGADENYLAKIGVLEQWGEWRTACGDCNENGGR